MVDEAQRKRSIDAASLAADGPEWPRPLVPLPWDLDQGVPSSDSGSGTGFNGGDGDGGATAVLMATAASVGAATVPIHLGLREAELLRLLEPAYHTWAATRLGRAVTRLAALLGVGRPAAATVVLSSGGRAAELVEQLPAEAEESVAQAMALVQRCSSWRRELQRYVFGNTSTVGFGDGHRGSGGGGAGGGSGPGVAEDLETVAASAWELLAVLREWRRVGRMEELAANGMQDAVSYVTVLQMPEEEWRDVAAMYAGVGRLP
ncbi:hypothetical protein GPECTOR_6g530 [Gonium pectorale]|uniref:Uncharacterized protein n=1 Tax=Gonium pectorale TaxID=33097 RepID=A0A150GV28_GONPE|nr:hypothetical protein GPECTOR_6g530 [Gonium pectorale]|eukprot:KXZ53613.1 hypothetical protein GPECTOR_6g530 [Gonium pectorale]